MVAILRKELLNKLQDVTKLSPPCYLPEYIPYDIALKPVE